MLKHIASLFALSLLACGLTLLVGCGDDEAGPDAPMEIIATTDFDQVVRSGIASEDHLLLVTSTREEDQVALRSFDVTDDGALEEAGSLNAPGSGHDWMFAAPSGIAIADDVAYVPLSGSDQPGLWVVDVSDPESPEELAFVRVESTLQSIDVEGDIAAVSGLLGAGLILFDVSNPENPEKIGSYPYSAVSETQVKLDGNFVYLADASGIAVIDVSEPDTPEEVAFYENVDWTEPDSDNTGERSDATIPDIAVEGEYLFVASGESGLEVLSIDDPANLERVAQLDMELRAVDLAIFDDTAYLLARGVLAPGVLDLPTALQRLDISDPENPELVDEMTDISTIPGSLQSLVAGEDYVYFLDTNQVDVLGEGE